MTKIFRPIAATAASSLVRDQKTSYQKPQPTFVPYPTPLTPEEVLGAALDNDPKQLKVPAYYNEVVVVSPFAKIDVLCSEMRRGLGVKGEEAMVDGAHDRDNVSDNEGIHIDRAGMYTWSKPVMKGTHPSPRDSHSSMAVGSKLHVFGGTDGTSPLNHTLCFGYFYQHFGDVPAPREGHSASLIGDNLFMFGRSGKSSDPSEEEYYNDLHVLNTNTFVWKKISTTGVSPISRDSHTLRTVSLSWVARTVKQWHGGATGVWATSNPSGPGPSPRFSLAGDSVNAERGILFFYGGCNEELEALDDMYFLDTEMLREKDPSEPKLSMRKELKRRRQEYRAMPFMLDKQRDADKSLVSSHGGICGKPWTSPIFPCQTHATEFQAHVQPLGEKMFEARVY
ncbi:hypothetical protein SELMODRAFT_432179 [Selaginella moellendorffii]|uniref:Uncharacterized protein n=1 Tax=Selaginella moellendorffii TaxID=88036 RepID=D8TF81_SELML|nr:hypothetical protein SELMODRAFT_432179 [Selaginella moellendorffii]